MDAEVKDSKSKIFCCVYGCSSTYNSEGVKSFHSFPAKGSGNVKVKNKLGIKESIDRHLAWKLRLKMGKEVSKYMKVCSLHFSDNNYFNTGNVMKRFVMFHRKICSYLCCIAWIIICEKTEVILIVK